MERTAAAREAVRNIRRTERSSITHWRMVYLLQHPGWRGKGIVVEQRGANSRVVLPELALETQVRGARNLELNDEVNLALTGVDLPMLDARFRLV
jgi:exoribonuclease-2